MERVLRGSGSIIPIPFEELPEPMQAYCPTIGCYSWAQYKKEFRPILIRQWNGLGSDTVRPTMIYAGFAPRIVALDRKPKKTALAYLTYYKIETEICIYFKSESRDEATWLLEIYFKRK